MTPDEDFIIDSFPGTDRVVVAAGFSGHGFKFAPLIGRLMSSLLLNVEPEFPLACSRFHVSTLSGSSECGPHFATDGHEKRIIYEWRRGPNASDH